MGCIGSCSLTFCCHQCLRMRMLPFLMSVGYNVELSYPACPEGLHFWVLLIVVGQRFLLGVMSVWHSTNTCRQNSQNYYHTMLLVILLMYHGMYTSMTSDYEISTCAGTASNWLHSIVSSWLGDNYRKHGKYFLEWRYVAVLYLGFNIVQKVYVYVPISLVPMSHPPSRGWDLGTRLMSRYTPACEEVSLWYFSRANGPGDIAPITFQTWHCVYWHTMHIHRLDMVHIMIYTMLNFMMCVCKYIPPVSTIAT